MNHKTAAILVAEGPDVSVTQVSWGLLGAVPLLELLFAKAVQEFTNNSHLVGSLGPFLIPSLLLDFQKKSIYSTYTPYALEADWDRVVLLNESLGTEAQKFA